MPNPRNYRSPPQPSNSAALSDKSQEWYVSIPFADLHKLMNEVQLMEDMKTENAQLRREMDGLRNMFNELLTQFGELRRELKGR